MNLSKGTVVMRFAKSTTRSITAIAAALLLAASQGCGSEEQGSTNTVKVALVTNLSGPYALQGELMKQGAELAIEDINASGGIKALNGAQMVLEIADAGDTVEAAVAATQRTLAKGGFSAAMGVWSSSYTLPASAVAEQKRIPWLTLSFADKITQRGYRYVFREDAPAGTQVAVAVPLLLEAASKSGLEIKTAILVGDNTASTVDFFNALNKVLPENHVQIVDTKVWTPPLNNPPSLALEVKNSGADVIFAAPSQFDDIVGMMRAFKEVGVTAPVLANGAQFLLPAVVDALGEENVEGLAAITGTAVFKGGEEISQRFEARYNTYMTQEACSTYTELWIIKEALERAKSADPEAVRDAISELDLSEGPATVFVPGHRVDFDETGQNIHAQVAISQWQNGKPITVAPSEGALGTLSVSAS